MIKALFVSDFILADEQGAKQSSIAHYNSLVEIFGKEYVDVVALNSRYRDDEINVVYWERHRNKLDKLKSIITNVPFLLSTKGENMILKLCKQNEYRVVFVDHSIYGHLIKRIKKEIGIPVVTYFHGIMQYQNLEYKKHNNTSFSFYLPMINMKLNEEATVRYSDIVLLLNKRDKGNFDKYYYKEDVRFLPVYYTDTANIKIKEHEKIFRLLFVGGYFWPNIHGIKWFVENVMPELPSTVSLDIVGNNMDKLRKVLSRENVRVHGRVECLDELYNNADAVIGPIFEGEGMKTKTCEALMYGKIYLGTDEALEGYIGLDDYRCNTKEEFIDKINKLFINRRNKFHSNIRDIYLQYYSPIMAKHVLEDIFRELKVKINSEK